MTMASELMWLGHGSWWLRLPGHRVLLDPFLDDNPAAPVKAADVDAEFILVSHGHYDHVADVASIANRCGATVVGCHEVAEWFRTKHRVQETVGLNTGGGIHLPFGHVQFTQAWHSSQMPDGSYGGQPGGYLLTLGQQRIYFACDTGFFGDMEHIGRKGVDIAVVPIGDRYTMGPEESIEAVRCLRPKRVLPAHYNTWPIIAQDAEAWAERIRSQTDAEPIVLQPGATLSF